MRIDIKGVTFLSMILYYQFKNLISYHHLDIRYEINFVNTQKYLRQNYDHRFIKKFAINFISKAENKNPRPLKSISSISVYLFLDISESENNNPIYNIFLIKPQDISSLF